MLRRLVSLVILHSLMVNPERYKYIVSLAEKKNEDGSNKYTNDELTEKNINKAFIMADQFLRFKFKRKNNDKHTH